MKPVVRICVRQAHKCRCVPHHAGQKAVCTCTTWPLESLLEYYSGASEQDLPAQVVGGW